MAQLPKIEHSVKIPDGVTVTVNDRTVTAKGPKGELTRTFANPRIQLVQDEKNFSVRCDLPRRKEKALTGTIASHIQNMCNGVNKGWEYKLKTVFSHFPIKTKVDGKTFVVENFLGERSARKARIVEGVKVQAKGEAVTVSGIDLEAVSQTAANIERATKVRYRDIRVFQDGIYVVERGASSQ